MAKNLNLKLHVWRQKNAKDPGHFQDLDAKGISTEMSFLEMLDVVNEGLIHKGEEPIVFDHDCREGICGACNLVINGRPHGPKERTTTCQLHMRSFEDGQEITIEPPRADVLPGDQGPDGGPHRLRPHHRRRGLHHRPHRHRLRRQRPAGAQAERRPGHGRGRLHRLRRLRGRLPQRQRHAVRGRQDQPPGPAAPGPARAGTTGPGPWSPRWTRRASVPAPTTANAKRCAPRASPWTTSPA